MSKSVSDLVSCNEGNIAVMSALALPACLGIVALAVDYGQLTLERRELQTVADLAAIAVASDMAHSDDAVLAHLKNNGLEMVFKTQQGWKTPKGVLLADTSVGASIGRVTVEKGRYAPDAALSPNARFKPTAQLADAVRVRVEQPGTLFFAGMFTTPPMLSATGTAAISKTAAFSIGSRLASLQGGLLNAILGKMLGAKLTFSAVDYRSLAAADIDVFRLTKGLATDLNLTAATYEEVLQAELTMPQLLSAVARYGGVAAGASGLVSELRRIVPPGGEKFTLGRFVDFGQKSRLRIDAKPGIAMKVGLLDLLQSSASLANGSNLVSVQTQAALPGLGTVDLDLAVGEPPVSAPPYRIGEPGQAVRTAQVRLAATIWIDGLAELLGTKIVLPLYVEVAHAEAKLADIQCHGGKPDNATVGIDAAPGVAEVSIGSVNTSAMKNFGSKPRVTRARLVDTPALAIDGMSSTTVGGTQIRRVTFSPSNIASGLTKSVSSTGLTTSATQSLITNLDLSVDVKLLLGLSLTPPKTLQAALAKTLGAVTPSLDALLDGVLATAGVRVGEADIQVTGVDCANPVLVQ
ncbi:pilus assembly protein TadG-related protein [Rhizobium sp. Leaf383]|uniref:pilus assembly protein TadG-related protein n=1 Tax=Rhizobium sp. Leaf383 TaxID=1736357 RepID=UPI00138F3B17|nr:pilus assembly protein TadG-related protein [Rhizobium sp. Leaf383]